MGEKGKYFITIRMFWTFNILRRHDRIAQLYFEALYFLSSGAMKIFSLLSNFFLICQNIYTYISRFGFNSTILKPESTLKMYKYIVWESLHYRVVQCDKSIKTHDNWADSHLLYHKSSSRSKVLKIQSCLIRGQGSTTRAHYRFNGY